MTTLIWLTAINLLLIVIWLIRDYFKNYAQEKGKNLATKEDIEEITEKVETVKSEIGLLAQKKISFHAEKYMALIECHSQYHTWINVILNTGITGDFNKADDFRNRAEQKLEAAFLEFLVSEAKFDIYFVGSGLLAVEGELRMKTIDLAGHLKIWLEKGRTISKQLAITDELEVHEVKIAKLEELFQKRHQLIVDYYQERNEKYSPIALLSGHFTQMIHAEVAKM